MSCEEFLEEILIKSLHGKTVVAGEDVSFGYKGRGDAEFLKQMEKNNIIKSKGLYYNLKGQTVVRPTKGLYIMNGKKYLVK